MIEHDDTLGNFVKKHFTKNNDIEIISKDEIDLVECFRLMGFTDEEFNRIKGVSNTQLYKMAGNSIVVNVLEAILKQLFKENHKE